MQEDDWENIDVLDLTPFNEKMREIKILEERKILEQKLVEEDDIQLTKDLFKPIQKVVIVTENQSIVTDNKPIVTDNQTIVNEKSNITRIRHPRPIIPNPVIQNRKEVIKRRKDIFGEASVDEYEEKYGYIADI